VLCRVADDVAAELERAGADVQPLLEGLEFNRETLREHRSRVGWDDYAEFVERARAAVGVARWSELCHGVASNHEAYAPFVALALEPRWLYVAYRSVATKFYENVFVPHRWDCVAPDAFEIDVEIRPGLRGSRAWMEGRVAWLAALPTHLGLPRARVESQHDERRGHFRVRLPSVVAFADVPVPALESARRRFVAKLDEELACQLAVAGIVEDESADSRVRPSPNPQALVGVAEREWKLTSRQREVLGRIVQGQSNKEIARELEIAEGTVEIHVSALLRKARAGSRGEVVALLWSLTERARR
jgi:DNA-binding CsgD family transcriptional regulator